MRRKTDGRSRWGRRLRPDCFVGRNRAVEALRALIREAEEGIPTIGFVTGERKIGKSWLMSYVREMAEREGRAVACYVHLDAKKDVDLMMNQMLGAVRDSVRRRWRHRAMEFLTRRGRIFKAWIVSLELRPPVAGLRLPEESFPAALRRLRAGSVGRDRPLLVILDDVDGVAVSDEFVRWLRSTVDEIATLGRGPKLCIVLMGAERRLRELREHRSFDARLIQKITVGTWTDSESEQFLWRMFGRAGVTVSDRSVAALVGYVSGFPGLAHAVGEAVVKRSDRSDVSDEQVEACVRTAAVEGGNWLLRGAYEAVQREPFRTILGRTGAPDRVLFRRADLSRGLSEAEQAGIDEFLRRMLDSDVIRPEPGEVDGYRFTSGLHALSAWLAVNPPPDP